MKYAELPYVNKKVSRILFGAAGEPFLAGKDMNIFLDEVFALGINAFDTARNYNLSEKSLGSWMESRENRDEVVILTKCGHPEGDSPKRVSEKAMREDYAQSREYLKTDYFDIYLLHRDDTDVEAGTVVEVFNALHAEKKIGAFGGSNWTHQRIEEANEYAYKHNLIPFTVSSPNFGLANQVSDPFGGGCVTLSGPANAQARCWYQKNQMPVISYSSLARGLFSGRVKSDHPELAHLVLDEPAMKGFGYPENFERLRRCELLASQKGCTAAQIAMAWLLSQPLNTFAVVSSSKVERMAENIRAMEIELTEAEMTWLQDVDAVQSL